MKKYILLFFILILMASSCHKETGPTTINGKVEDKTTGAGVADADVGLFETDGESAWGLGGVLIAEVYSDASGNFTFDFEARNGYSYYVQAIKDQYWNNDTDNIVFVDDTGGETNVTVFLQPEGWLIVRVHNINSYEIDDVAYINGLDSDPYYGDDIDILDTITVYGNENTSLILFLYTSAGNDTINYEIYCPSFDTTYYEILY